MRWQTRTHTHTSYLLIDVQQVRSARTKIISSEICRRTTSSCVRSYAVRGSSGCAPVKRTESKRNEAKKLNETVHLRYAICFLNGKIVINDRFAAELHQ